MLQRWISPDPLAVHTPGEADLNLYAYVRGQALKAIDPLGLEDVTYAEDGSSTFEVTSSHPTDPSKGCNGDRCGTIVATVPKRVDTGPAPTSTRKRDDPDAGLAPQSSQRPQILTPGKSELTWRVEGQGDEDFALFKVGDDTRGELTLTPTWMKYSITDRKLQISPDSGQPYEVPATSGTGECLNNAACLGRIDKGPIVPGTYTVWSSEISEPSLPRALVRQLTGDWGAWRVPARPDAWTEQRITESGRTGDFFVHGGSRTGSAGCIDCGGGLTGDETTDKILEDLRTAPSGKVRLFVWE